MSNNSAPVFEKAPTFDEVVEYAVRNGLFGQISLTKFYDYYGDFKSKGIVIDWKAKLRMWAEHQRSAVIVSAKEYEALERIKGRKEYTQAAAKDVIADLQARVAMI